MVPALGSAEKNKITEYKDVRAYILFRKPEEIRLIGLYPVVRNKAFDMVSKTADFRLYIPAQNRFIMGKNEVVELSKNKLENLRPEHFLEALMVRPVDPDKRQGPDRKFHRRGQRLSTSSTSSARTAAGELRLSRTIWFNRLESPDSPGS